MTIQTKLANLQKKLWYSSLNIFGFLNIRISMCWRQVYTTSGEDEPMAVSNGATRNQQNLNIHVHILNYILSYKIFSNL